MRLGPTRTIPLLAVVWILALTACTGTATSQIGDAMTETSAAESEFVDTARADIDAAPDTTASSSEGADRSTQAEPGGPPLGEDGVEPVSLTPADIGRDIIFTADLTTAVTDVLTAGEEATRVIQSLGGLVFGQRTTGGPEPETLLTFKVRPEDFQPALDRLGSIGELRDQTITADDVTERVVDLQSRIATAEASVERLRAFLADASEVTTIANLENQLLQRETDLETLRGQLRTVQDQVSLATIVLRIVEANARPSIELVVTALAGEEDAGEQDAGSGCPGQAPLEVDQATPVTVCFQVTNTGDTVLRDLTLTDPVLDLNIGDLVTVLGDPTLDMQPGDTLLLAGSVAPERDLRTRTTVAATAVDASGEPIPTRDATTTISLFIDTVVPEGIPSFTQGLETSWGLLVNLLDLAILVIGALLPFVWVIPLVWWFDRRRRAITRTPVADPVAEAIEEPSTVT